MAEKKYSLSLEQLNELVSDAVATAIKKLENVEIIDDDSAEKPAQTEVKVSQMDEEQYREAMDTMAKNRGAGDEPKVGIFWYNAARKELFGVVTHKRTDYLKPNAGGGLITCSEMHEDVWKKELRRQKYHGDGTGPFKGEYQMRPRGRVFYSPADDQYIIAVDTWIDESPEAVDQIIDEFEPALDYVVCKIPRWDLSKFHGVNHELGSSMKSVGEVMAIGRTFEEAMQKGLRMIGQGMHGFVDNRRPTPDPSREGGETSGELNITSGNASLPLRGDLEGSLQHATDTRIFVIAQAMLMGYTVEQIHSLTKIDRWFLQKLKHIIDINDRLRAFSQVAYMAEVMDPLELIEYLEAPEFVHLLREAKVYGFSDFQIARALGLGATRSMEEAGLTVRRWRKELGIQPTVNQIDTLAAEYPAQTNYLYLSY